MERRLVLRLALRGVVRERHVQRAGGAAVVEFLKAPYALLEAAAVALAHSVRLLHDGVSPVRLYEARWIDGFLVIRPVRAVLAALRADQRHDDEFLFCWFAMSATQRKQKCLSSAMNDRFQIVNCP